jgi:CheY-like chemotaxis protein
VPKENTLKVLLVDDDATDRELFVDAINLVGKKFTVSEAANGEEAIEYLTSTAVLPDLIILDLNMPVKDGRMTLRELKQHDLFRRIPVCIMSTSSAHFDVLNAYEDRANLFLVKPHDFKELIEMLSSLLTLFSKYVTLAEKPVKKIL